MVFNTITSAETKKDTQENSLPNCKYKEMEYSEGFVLVLEEGKKLLRCTKVINSQEKEDLAWVRVDKEPNKKDGEFTLKLY